MPGVNDRRVAHKSTGGIPPKIPTPVGPVGNAPSHLTPNTVALSAKESGCAAISGEQREMVTFVARFKRPTERTSPLIGPHAPARRRFGRFALSQTACRSHTAGEAGVLSAGLSGRAYAWQQHRRRSRLRVFAGQKTIPVRLSRNHLRTGAILPAAPDSTNCYCVGPGLPVHSLTLRLSRRRSTAGTFGVGWPALGEAIAAADPRDTQVKALQFFFYAESKGEIFRCRPRLNLHPFTVFAKSPGSFLVHFSPHRLVVA
jgi:hypothetical protein